jgi:hypothetical protein
MLRLSNRFIPNQNESSTWASSPLNYPLCFAALRATPLRAQRPSLLRSGQASSWASVLTKTLCESRRWRGQQQMFGTHFNSVSVIPARALG